MTSAASKKADDARKNAGKTGEDTACERMKDAGYDILARNYAEHNIGEIDIIASDGHDIVFCEVKTRGAHPLDRPAAAVSRSKQTKICRTALCYLQKNPTELQPRFDVIEVFGRQAGGRFSAGRINWLKNAFGPPETLRFF